ncbi:MAG: hydroxymethylbilane synthase [Fimbriimonadaceae bacterium]|nr:hydroxymethylbilane synthase [Fimbriimonadaceae bacterium]
MPDLVVATRGSLLALTQTKQIVAALQALHPGLEVELHEHVTTGDRQTSQPLPEIGGKGLFTAELEAALLGGQADLAVHSLKDLPTTLPDGLLLAAVPERVEALDALVLPATATAADLPGELGLLPLGARVGTSSLRRAAFLKHRRPDLAIGPVRGNLDTRLRKLDEGQYEALVLAAAGLSRLDWGHRISRLLSQEWCVPAPAQGALGLEARAGDARVLALLAGLDHAPSRAAVLAERAVLAALGGGCAVPLGVHGHVVGDALVLRAALATPDGSVLLEREAVGSADQPLQLGAGLAAVLLAAGAGRLLG